MARRLPNKKQQAVRFFTNGVRANNAYGLFEHVGQIVRRSDVAQKRAAATTARRAQPIAREEVLKRFTLRPGQLNGKFRTVTTGDSIRLFASERRVSLIAFGGKWGGIKTEGATAEIQRGKRETFPQAFIRTVQGLRAIRVRSFKGGKRAPRGPLTMLRGPSPKDMVTGLRTDAETRSPEGRYPDPPAQHILARLTAEHVAELKRQLALELKRG